MLTGHCRPQTRALLQRWRDDMLDASKAHLIAGDGQGNWTVTDQLALTLIFAVLRLVSRLLARILRARDAVSLLDTRQR